VPNSGLEVYLWPGKQGSFRAARAHGWFAFCSFRGSFREAQTQQSGKLQEREIGRLHCAAAIGLNQYLDQWLNNGGEAEVAIEELYRLRVAVAA